MTARIQSTPNLLRYFTFAIDAAADAEKPQQLKNLLEAQLLLGGIDARLKRVEKMQFNDG